jgi:hypothetical protein
VQQFTPFDPHWAFICPQTGLVTVTVPIFCVDHMLFWTLLPVACIEYVYVNAVVGIYACVPFVSCPPQFTVTLLLPGIDGMVISQVGIPPVVTDVVPIELVHDGDKLKSFVGPKFVG